MLRRARCLLLGVTRSAFLTLALGPLRTGRTIFEAARRTIVVKTTRRAFVIETTRRALVAITTRRALIVAIAPR